MKVSIAVNNDRNSVCPTFARAPLFMIYDTNKDEKIFVENTAFDAQGGAGIKAAQILLDNGIDVLIAERCGQNAANVFKAADIKLYSAVSNVLDENIDAYKKGELSSLTDIHPGYHGARGNAGGGRGRGNGGRGR